ncbi:MAG: YcaO-like family protein [Bacteroidota bacterium]
MIVQELRKLLWDELMNLPFSVAKWDLPFGMTNYRSGIVINFNEIECKMIGSACARSPSNALLRSKCEALERLISRLIRDYSSDFIINKVNRNGEVIKESGCKYSEIFRIKQNEDSTGIALHKDLKESLQHGYFELIERSLLAEFWYGNGLPLTKANEEKLEGAVLTTWIAKLRSKTLAICEIYDSKNGFQTFGSAVRNKTEDAMQHSIQEVLMLYSSYNRAEFPLFHTSSVLFLTAEPNV